MSSHHVNAFLFVMIFWSSGVFRLNGTIRIFGEMRVRMILCWIYIYIYLYMLSAIYIYICIFVFGGYMRTDNFERNGALWALCFLERN